MDKLAEIGMSNTFVGQPGGFIDARANLLRPRIAPLFAPAVRFDITTNNGNAYSTDQTMTALQGRAPADVCEIIVSINGDAGSGYPVRYTSLRDWRIDDIEIEPGENEITLFGLDLRGNVSADDSITVTSTAIVLPPPVLLAIDPTTAYPGASVELTGQDFAAGARVFFGEVRSLDVVVHDATRITATVPVGSGEVGVTVQNIGSARSSAVAFQYPPPPVLVSIDPDTASPGAAVEIAGSGFGSGVRVFFGGREATGVVLVDENSLTAVVPEPDAFAPVDVIVMNSTLEPSNAVGFSYPPTFIRGDLNRDNRVDLSDAIKVLLVLFSGHGLACDESADANDDGAIDISDAIFLMDFLYRDGFGIPAPFPREGIDRDDDGIGCEL
jgi:hypothetical protein